MCPPRRGLKSDRLGDPLLSRSRLVDSQSKAEIPVKLHVWALVSLFEYLCTNAVTHNPVIGVKWPAMADRQARKHPGSRSTSTSTARSSPPALSGSTARGLANSKSKDSRHVHNSMRHLKGWITLSAVPRRRGVVTRTKFGPREDWKSQLRFRLR
jgi:hypothetical protein